MRASEEVRRRFPNAKIKLTEFKPVSERPKRYYTVYSNRTALGEGRSENAAWVDAFENIKVKEFYQR